MLVCSGDVEYDTQGWVPRVLSKCARVVVYGSRSQDRQGDVFLMWVVLDLNGDPLQKFPAGLRGWRRSPGPFRPISDNRRLVV